MNNDKQAVTVDASELPTPAAFMKSSEWDDALKKRQSFNGWRIKYSDCDMALYTAEQVNAHTSAAVARAVAEKDAEILALHRKFAAETLRADQGWARYEQANTSRMALEMERAAQAAPVAASDLHAQIMNMPQARTEFPTRDHRHNYAEGHRDARHAAAELASARTQQPAAVPAEPTQANAGPEQGDMPIDRFIASVPLPMYNLKEQPTGELPVLPEPSAQEQKLVERTNWTTKQWYEHVGAWEDKSDQIVFGSVMALRAMMIQYGTVALYSAGKLSIQQSAPVADWCSECHARESMPVSEFEQGRAAGIEEAAKVCDAQSSEPECPERAQHCADAIRAINKTGAV